jgi:uncharacterized membrane protein YczE
MYTDLYAKFLVQMFRYMLGTVDTAVTPARTAKSKLQVGEASFYITRCMNVGQLIYVRQEGKYLAILLQETHHRSI